LLFTVPGVHWGRQRRVLTVTLVEDGGDTLGEDEMAIWCSSEVSLPCSH